MAPTRCTGKYIVICTCHRRCYRPKFSHCQGKL